MNWSRRLALGIVPACIVVNTLLMVDSEHRRRELRKEAANLTQLADEVTRKSAELKALADSLPPCGPKKQSAPAPKSGKDYVAEASSSCALIHRPKAGCPKGYAQEKRPRFTERDGSHEFACISEDPAKEPCVDQLGPGESFEMHFVIPVPQEPEPTRVEGPRT